MLARRSLCTTTKSSPHWLCMKQKLGVYYQYLEGLENLQKNTGIQARMPFDLIIE